MSHTIFAGDFHLGNTFESYKPTAPLRLHKANTCIKALNRFQKDHRNQIQRVIILGDLCQRTGQRAASAELEERQLYELGNGMMNHDANIVYIAGSADPYMDEKVMGVPQERTHEYIADTMGIDRDRLTMPGLAHRDNVEAANLIATHGHLSEVALDKKLHRDFLLYPSSLVDLMRSEVNLQLLRMSEDRHQTWGKHYERLYRNLVRKLPEATSKFIDRELKKHDYISSLRNIRTLGLPDNSIYCFGHKHVPMNCEVDSIKVLNPGSLTGSFRMDPMEPGTFMTIENLEDPASRSFHLWTIHHNGEYTNSQRSLSEEKFSSNGSTRPEGSFSTSS